MKKILIYIFIISIWIINNSYAVWWCAIKNDTADVLLDYQEYTKTIISNVTSDITSANDNILTEINDTISVFNEIFNFTSYYSYFRYFAVYPISNEVPSEITRDYKTFKEEYKSLIAYLKQIDNSWSTHIKISNACNWVPSSVICDFNDKTAKEIVWALLENNDKITDLYRLTVIWEPIEYSWSDFILVNESTFLDNIEANYWQESVNTCNEEWDLFEKVTKAIKNIKLLNKEAEDWIKEWKEGWALLIWNKPEEERKIEKEELKEYLDEKWISAENQDILDDNLNKYNQGWISENNNFVSNSVNSVFSKVSKDLEKWKKWVADTFFEEQWYLSDPDSKVSTNDLTNVSSNSKISKDIQKNITTLFEKEIPHANVWDVETEKLRSKIIDTHFSLDNSINTLAKACKKSVKFCNRQDKWNWDCWKCD